MAQTLGAQRIGGLKVETNSGIGGNEIRARRKHFHGWVERKSWKGGSNFRVGRKGFQGKVEAISGRKIEKRKDFRATKYGVFSKRGNKFRVNYALLCPKNAPLCGDQRVKSG